MLTASIRDTSDAVVEEYGTFIGNTHEARNALAAIQDKIRAWFNQPQRVVTHMAAQALNKFVDAELDFTTPGDRGLGRIRTNMPRLAARHRHVVSRMDIAAFQRVRFLVDRHMLCGYAFSEYRYDLTRDKEPKLSAEKLYKVWIPTIYLYWLSVNWKSAFGALAMVRDRASR